MSPWFACCLGWLTLSMASTSFAGPRAEMLDAGGTPVYLTLDPEFGARQRGHILDWTRRGLAAVQAFYHRFPVDKLSLHVRATDGTGAQGGSSRGLPYPFIRVSVGLQGEPARSPGDWVMVHELVHLAIPDLHQRHQWLEEGLATYVEPLARVGSGQIPVDRVWRELIKGLPQGLPRSGDAGLDHTPTWGRIYWGGALFCLLADIRIREQSRGRHGLPDALRGILAAGGNGRVHWPIERLFAAADRAVGNRVLSELYAAMRAEPHPVDLPRLWKQLGVSLRHGSVRYDDSAPLAAIRRAITAPH